LSTTRSSRLKRATTIVPLALLSAAWTASLATANTATTTAASDDTTPGGLPDGAEVPTEAIEAPASVSSPDAVGSAFDGDRADFDQIVANSSTNGIPASALAAYQRAETVINAADKSCNITWQLVAAIGRVESNHGRFGGNALDSDGLARPGIFGIPLDGSNNTAVIRDTDAARFDNDAVFDRAVGPMQFIPSTWAVVGVDADGDGERNPQDIDDAALATAVYLCSGSDDLSTVGGQRAAVYRYNHSQAYVDLVLEIMNNYLSGDYMSVPDGTVAGGYIAPLPPAPSNPGGRGGNGGRDGNGGGSSSSDGGTGSTGGSTDGGSTGGTTGGGTGGTGGGTTGGGGGTPVPEPPPAPAPTPNVPVNPPDVPDTGVPPVDDTISRAEALARCTAQGIVDLPLTQQNELENCIQNLIG
jgi:membrane-bound lytic murein transglycosylase B